jgi:hypothetical protein
MSGALSDERTGLSFAKVTVISSKSCQYVQFTFYMLLNVCIYVCMYVCINLCIYNIYKGLCQSRLSTTNNALLLIAPATTAVYALERSYAWPPIRIWPPFRTFREPCRNHLLKGFCFYYLCMRCAGNVFSTMVTESVVQQRTSVLVDSVTLGNVFS